MYFTPEVIKLKTVKRKGGHELTGLRSSNPPVTQSFLWCTRLPTTYYGLLDKCVVLDLVLISVFELCFIVSSILFQVIITC